MRNVTRAGAVVFAAATAATVLLPATGANAVSAGDKPEKHHKVKVVKAAPPPRGEIVICNHSGYMFDVYADGPSLRTDDLAGSFDECSRAATRSASSCAFRRSRTSSSRRASSVTATPSTRCSTARVFCPPASPRTGPPRSTCSSRAPSFQRRIDAGSALWAGPAFGIQRDFQTSGRRAAE
jgi:hypothetical protein